MAMDGIAEKNYQMSEKFLKTLADITQRALAAIAKFLEEHAKTDAQREMAKFIRGGGQLYAYSVQGDRNPGVKGELQMELEKNGISYIVCNDMSTILIKEEDMESVREVNRNILVTRSNYFQEVDLNELEKAIATAPFIKDKELFIMQNLNKYEAEVLKNKCNHIAAGFTVGSEKNADGSVNIGIHEEGRLYADDPKKDDFCKAYLKMTLSLYGPNHKIKQAQIDADEAIDEQVRSLKGCQTQHYIVGADDHSQYIVLHEKGFTYTSDVLSKGKMTRKSYTCDITDPDYDIELQRYMDGIYNRVIIDDPDLLDRHLDTNNEERVVQTDRPRRSKDAYNVSVADNEAAEQINLMIHNNIEETGKTFESGEAQFDYYTKQASNIMQAAIDNEIPKGYTSEEMKTLHDIFDSRNVRLQGYREISSRLETYKTAERKASERNVGREYNTNRGDNER